MIEADKIAMFLKEYLRKRPLLLSDVVEIGEETKTLDLSFQPYAPSAQLIVPEGFPLDANELIFSLLSNQEWQPSSDILFGMLAGNVATGPSNQYVIGCWSSQMVDSPHQLATKLQQGLKNNQQANLTKICEKNSELMKVVEKIIYNSDNDITDITIPHAKSVAELLCYSLGGKLTPMPEQGVSFKVSMPGNHSLTIPSRGKSSAKKHKRLVKGLMKEYLSKVNVPFGKEASTLVIN